MYSLDTNTNIAVERQAERVRAIQSIGLSHMPKPAAKSWPTDDAPHNWGPAGIVRAGLVMAVLAIGMLLAVAASTGGAGGLVAALVK